VAPPVRMCRVCRQRRPKAVLARWVLGDGGPVRDPKQVMSGRGVYTCSAACAEQLARVTKRGR
jgi:predicted RNA-binding protein YlxR (DUF448 family)